MTKFIKWKELCKKFFNEVLKGIIDKNFPDLKYSAGLLGSGSEVLWFDTERSTDHHWWPRVMIFLEEKDFYLKDTISKKLSKELPWEFKWYYTNFTEPNKDDFWVQLLKKQEKWKPINHRVEFFTINSFFLDYLWINPYNDLNSIDWFVLSEHKLRTIKDWEVFYDEIWLLEIKKKFDYYPKDVWLYLLSSEWEKIWQEEPFVWRTWEVDDELWSKVIAVRLIQSIMNICFLMEKKYIPYSKWFWTGFSKLESASKLTSILNKAISSINWKEREKYISEANEILANLHNNLKITKSLNTKVSNFHGRPFLVIHWDVFAQEIKKQIKDKNILNIKANIGSVNQITNTVDLIENNELLSRIKNLYK